MDILPKKIRSCQVSRRKTLTVPGPRGRASLPRALTGVGQAWQGTRTPHAAGRTGNRSCFGKPPGSLDASTELPRDPASPHLGAPGTGYIARCVPATSPGRSTWTLADRPTDVTAPKTKTEEPFTGKILEESSPTKKQMEF